MYSHFCFWGCENVTCDWKLFLSSSVLLTSTSMFLHCLKSIYLLMVPIPIVMTDYGLAWLNHKATWAEILLLSLAILYEFTHIFLLMSYLSACFHYVPLVDLPESEKLALSLCSDKDRPSIWKTIYFECLSSGKHFLEQVLVSVAGPLEKLKCWLKCIVQVCQE